MSATSRMPLRDRRPRLAARFGHSLPRSNVPPVLASPGLAERARTFSPLGAPAGRAAVGSPGWPAVLQAWASGASRRSPRGLSGVHLAAGRCVSPATHQPPPSQRDRQCDVLKRGRLRYQRYTPSSTSHIWPTVRRSPPSGTRVGIL